MIVRDPDAEALSSSWPRRLRLLLLGAGLLLLWLAAERSGAREALTPERLRALAAAAGPWGVLLFLGAAWAGGLAQIPGVVFLLGARAAFGAGPGLLIGYAGAVGGALVTFSIVRLGAGGALGAVRWGPARRLLARLEQRPVGTIVLLRTLLWTSPPLNYALAASTVRLPEYALGTALGLLAPVAGVVLGAGCAAGLAQRVLG